MNWLLVAEDHDDLREQLAAALRGYGYRVRTASDGPEALRILRAAADMPEAVLLDFLMPQLTGWEVLQSMRSSDRMRHVPVVVLTALEPQSTDLHAFDVADVLQKPVAVERLLDALDKARGHRPCAGPLQRQCGS